MRSLLSLLVLLVAVAEVRAEPPGQRFVAISFHDVVDDPADLTSDAISTRRFVQFLDWLKGTGWQPVTLDDLSAAARGERKLPAKAILLTFDDGFRSLYTRVFPLLKAYHYPAVAALVGAWMEDTPEDTVQEGDKDTVLYGDKRVPRTNFISWDEAREMQKSGLVEFASHSYDLHRGVQANPQGSMVPSAVTWRYDPLTRTYEDDARYIARIRDDLIRSRLIMQANLGSPPRAVVWPYGRYTGLDREIAKELGFSFAMTLEPEPASTSDLFAIHRYFPSGDPTLGDIVANLRFEPARSHQVRVACVTLDAIAAAGSFRQQDEVLGRIIDGLRELGINTVIIDANAALPSTEGPLGEVYFPSQLRPTRADILGRATWQIRKRGGADIFLHIPVAAATKAVGVANVPRLYAEMVRYARPEGVVIDLPPPFARTAIVADRPEIARARRAAIDVSGLNGPARLALTSYRAAAAISPRLRVMLAMGQPIGPPEWADIGLLPPSRDAAEIAALADRLRAEGWLRPEVAGRVIFSLPRQAERQVKALRAAQGRGATAFALCPKPPPLPPKPALAAAFSAATYPYRP